LSLTDAELFKFAIDVVQLGAAGAFGFYLSRRTELHDRVANLVTEIEEVEELGVKYWTSVAGSPEQSTLEGRIRGRMNRVSMEITRLNTRHFTFRFKDHHVTIAFRQALTLGPFGEKSALPDPGRAREVRARANDLVMAVRNAHKFI